LNADPAPQFFGAGGPKMAEAGVELAFDLTRHSLIGLPGPLDSLKLRRLLHQLVLLAREREPHAIICVDFQWFNSLLAKKIRKYVEGRRDTINNWQPKIIKYISPQVWASREYRAHQIARDFDLLLSIIPFEEEWYAAKVPKLRVEFVGHPMIDRYQDAGSSRVQSKATGDPLVVLLPGSRSGELKRHLPIMLPALRLMQAAIPNLRACMVLSRESLVMQAKMSPLPSNLEIRCGDIAETLREATVAIAKTGTITMECACFGVPTVTLYKPSWITYQIGKRIIKVKSATMPNLLAQETVFPEFVEEVPTPENISRAALELLRDKPRREKVQARLAEVIASLGGPGASRRAAAAILKIVP
jgi:lipid-A-disaccharide synthase